MPTARTRLRVTGTVQGVGFRPFVYRHAVALGLDGFVLNDSEGVLIDVEGDSDRIAELTRLLVEDAPPLARVAGVQSERLPPAGGAGGFRIVESYSGGAPAVPVSIDSATCDDCLIEIFDPSDRRHRYAFTNCTNCGPRYTIVLGVPYDRPMTTMAGFAMCPPCQAEYDDPSDRRFHAQPNACPTCGPQLAWTETTTTQSLHGGDALDAAIDALMAGRIIAMKGIGGYHLVVDATDEHAVAELRRRKARDDKPFAVMVGDLEQAERLCVLDDATRRALQSPRRPIVLARRVDGTTIAHSVAPNLPELGIMLPYSPLHHLVHSGVGRSLVMTSGNASDEPIAHEDDDAADRLGVMVDGILAHDRAIHIRCDDSVVRSTAGGVRVMRRSRGYAPEPLRLPFATRRAVLAVGAELKNTISVADHDWVVPSHHIGDLEHLATYRSFVQAVGHISDLYGVTPQLVAHDMHPEYLSTKFAVQLDLPTLAVQHHHAHIAACMVEHGRTQAVLGLAFDGLGYGPDGTLWGGEFLVADLTSFRRIGHLRPAPMPGGSQAIREPWRMAAVWAATTRDREAVARLLPAIDATRVNAVLDLAAAPMTRTTTSVGRLFDAVAALLGCRTKVTYEAQAAIELEALARTSAAAATDRYHAVIARQTTAHDVAVLDPTPLIAVIVDDVARGEDPAEIASAFHHELARATVEMAIGLAERENLSAVALTGGVFQNALLAEVVERGLTETGIAVLTHSVIPTNDGGISVGQAAIAAFSP